MSTSNYQQTPFVRQLAASDRPTRDKAVASLKTYLTASRTFTKTELLKLWKGLFYCFWHSDRPRPQQALANDLAELLTPMNEANATTFYRAFWETMAREWSGIDVLRVDKFLLLVRRYLAVGFRYCRARKWHRTMVDGLLLRTLEQTVLDPRNQKMPCGVRFQLADIWVEELDKVFSGGDSGSGGGGKELDSGGKVQVRAETLELLVRPWETMARDGVQKIWRKKALEVLADEKWREWGCEERATRRKDEGEGGDGEEEGEWSGFD